MSPLLDSTEEHRMVPGLLECAGVSQDIDRPIMHTKHRSWTKHEPPPSKASATKGGLDHMRISPDLMPLAGIIRV